VLSPQSIQLAALAPLGFLMVADGPTSGYALWGMLFTLIASLIGRYLDNRKEENRHNWEIEDRARQAEEIRKDLVAHRIELVQAIAKQTAENSAQIEDARASAALTAGTVRADLGIDAKSVRAELLAAASTVRNELATEAKGVREDMIVNRTAAAAKAKATDETVHEIQKKQ
jgi:hypothetical protein